MLSKIRTLTLFGLEARVISVEVDIHPGLHKFSIVGLAGKSVQESKDRVAAALTNAGYQMSYKKMTVNLSPADIVKNSASFDLPIAIGILIATGQVDLDLEDCAVWGEMSLEGNVLSTKGALAITDGAKRLGFKRIILPQINANEAGIVSGIELSPLGNIAELNEPLTTNELTMIPEKNPVEDAEKSATIARELDFAHVRGQESVKRIAEIAAAGGHNLLLNGVPGSGKTLISRCIAGILPGMQYEEMIEVTKIYSVSGLLEPDTLITERPFRSPHHTSSHASLIGGGAIPKPGEITLAHKGVLFLDEFNQFETRALESLRQPLEDKRVHILRVSGVMVYPADFMLVAAMNPCKCGNIDCTCSRHELEKYRSKLSGPILDRIDLQMFVNKVETKDLLNESQAESSDVIKARVEKAREFQIARFREHKFDYAFANADLNQLQLKTIVNLNQEAKNLLERIVDSMDLSARGYFRLLKVARTIADLELSDCVRKEHVAEAAGYRVMQK